MESNDKSRVPFRRAFVPATVIWKRVDFDDLTMRVPFTDGRRLSVPLSWFPILRDATPKQRAKYEIGGGSLHWPDIDEDVSNAGVMAGVDRSAG
jgi:Protein of unknown function (DUF2442)